MPEFWHIASMLKVDFPPKKGELLLAVNGRGNEALVLQSPPNVKKPKEMTLFFLAIEKLLDTTHRSVSINEIMDDDELVLTSVSLDYFAAQHFNLLHRQGEAIEPVSVAPDGTSDYNLFFRNGAVLNIKRGFA